MKGHWLHGNHERTLWCTHRGQLEGGVMVCHEGEEGSVGGRAALSAELDHPLPQ